MLVSIAIGIACIWALVMFSGRITTIINKIFGMAERGVNVADKYVEEWEQDVDMRIKTKAALQQEARDEDLAAINKLRESAGKKALEL